MFRKVLILTAYLLGCWTCELQAGVVNSKWVGGEQGEWGNASNWKPGVVPDNSPFNTFAVTIDSNSIGVGEVRIGLPQERTIRQLDCYGVVILQAWTWYLVPLTIQDGLTNHGSLTLDKVDIKGDVTNVGGAELEFWAHQNIYGNLYNLAGATLKFDRHDIDIEGQRIENDGLIFCTGNGGPGEQPFFENRGTIQLFGGGCGASEIFYNNSTGEIEGFGAVVGHQLIRNRGAIRASTGTLLLYTEGSLTNSGMLKNSIGAGLHIRGRTAACIADVNNQGTVEVSAEGSVVFDCNLVNEPNGVVKLLGGTLAAQKVTQSPGATLEGFGGITGNVVIDPNGIMKLTGPTNIVGDVTISQNATLEISDGTTLITGQTTCNGTIHMKGGRIIPQGGLSGDCNIVWEPGAYSNIADFNLDGRVDIRDFADFADTWLWQLSW